MSKKAESHLEVNRKSPPAVIDKLRQHNRALERLWVRAYRILSRPEVLAAIDPRDLGEFLSLHESASRTNTALLKAAVRHGDVKSFGEAGSDPT